MSAKVTGMVFDRYPEGGGEMLLALALADHAHDDGTSIFPSIARLAAKTRQSQRSVQYQLRRMEESGWLILVSGGKGGRKPGSESQGRTREYRINPAWMNAAEIAPLDKAVDNSEKGAEIAPFDASKGANGDIKGCNPRRERVQSTTSKGATAIAPESSVNHQEPSENPQRATAKTAKTGKLAGFDEFWSAYPRKQGRADAERAWQKLAPDPELLATILKAIGEQKAWPTWREEGGKFVPHAATWLNGRRWTDQAQPPAAPGETPAASTNWWQSNSATKAMADSLGVTRKPAEEEWRFRVRVARWAGEGPWRQEILADLLRTKNSAYAGVHEYFYGHPPEAAA